VLHFINKVLSVLGLQLNQCFFMNDLLAGRMHPINRVLSVLGLQLSRMSDEIRKFQEQYERNYEQVIKNGRGFKAIKHFRYMGGGSHPTSISDLHAEFVSYHLYKAKPKKVLDIGSYRLYILGLLAHYDVTTIDFRERKSRLDNETIITSNARALDLSDHSFDAVVSLAALANFGLGRYGDEFDLDADIKAVNEMIRVLKPGGLLIFEANIANTEPTILWNRARVYDLTMIRNLCANLDCVEEKFFKHRPLRNCSFEELATDPKHFDSYLGCWRKK